MTFECPSSRMSYRKHIIAFYILNLFFQLLSFDWGFNPFTLKEIADRKDLTSGILFLVSLTLCHFLCLSFPPCCFPLCLTFHGDTFLPRFISSVYVL